MCTEKRFFKSTVMIEILKLKKCTHVKGKKVRKYLGGVDFVFTPHQIVHIRLSSILCHLTHNNCEHTSFFQHSFFVFTTFKASTNITTQGTNQTIINLSNINSNAFFQTKLSFTTL